MENEGKFKSLAIGLGVLVVVLVGILVWVLMDKKEVVTELSTEKDTLTEQMLKLKDDYAQLTSNNDTLNIQLEKEREKVDQLIEKVRKTEASNTKKLRQYEQELGTLRSIMKSYISQIDSLNNLNTSLKKDVAQARTEAQETKQKYDELQVTTEEYAKQVQKGAALKGRGVALTALTSSDKETQRSGRAAKLRACLSLVENTIATKGPRKIYMRIKGPDGILLTNDLQQIFNFDGEQLIYTAVREVDYQGEEIEVCIYFNNSQEFMRGVYSVEVYSDNAKLGSGDLLLR